MVESSMASKTAASTRKFISKADRIRDREFFHLFPSPSISKSGTTIPLIQPDPVLTALAQLVAIRLNVSRALINVISKDTQYTISEGTKTLDLGDYTHSALDEDALWIGCGGSLQKEQALCQNTVNLPVSENGMEGSFTVPDLSQDPRFASLFYVAGPPYWRFYIGTPLTSKNGIHIGALCILDNKPRDCLTTEQEAFCQTIAQTIMNHLETKREAEELKKSTRMSKGLNAFVEGKSCLDMTGQPPVLLPTSQKHSHHKKDSRELSNSTSPVSERTSPTDLPQDRNVSRRQARTFHSSSSNNIASGVSERLHSSRDTNDSPANSGDHEISQDESDSGTPKLDIDVGYRSTFKRAANLLRESLGLTNTGGVAFFDTALGFHGTQGDSPSSSTIAGLAINEEDGVLGGEPETLQANITASDNIPACLEDFKRANVLGSSIDQDAIDENKPFRKDRLCSLNEKYFHGLFKRYPRGKLWTFDESGVLSSSDEEVITPTTPQQKKSTLRSAEARSLQASFPGARQLLFAPLWDAGASRWFSGCFCWTNSEQQVFTADLELTFLSAFNNSVMAEVSRLATITADKSKGDFIGSISHELRSPLHGILASAEFLAETDCDTFQMSLVTTIDSCGRTLLDTINHVLDFSKINTFERNWKKAQKVRNNSRNDSTINSKSTPVNLMPGGAPPLLNIYALVDVAAICEEVVEAVYAGQVYQNMSSADMTDLTATSRGRTFDRGLPMIARSHFAGSTSLTSGRSIDIILDIEKGDYNFTTQPGALRRVIMNIFGNALKYTHSGRVIVKLEMHDIRGSHVTEQDEENEKSLVITVTDTGKGISANYLKTRLFTPFAQENSLAPGTGLGLSIVRSITNMLGGSITVRSQVDKGTEVCVHLPMMRIPSTGTPVSTPGTTTSLDRLQDDSVSILQSQTSGKTVALYGFGLDTDTDNSSFIFERVIRQYITSWCGLDIITPWSSTGIPDIIVVDEQNLPGLLSQQAQCASFIVLCDNVSHCSQPNTQLGGTNIVEMLMKPFGPYKLAKSLRACLERLSSLTIGLAPIQEVASREESASSHTETLVQDIDKYTLERGDQNTPFATESSGIIVAAESRNAQVAIGSSSTSSLPDDMVENKGVDFPFPSQNLALLEDTPDGDLVRRHSESSEFAINKSDSTLNGELHKLPDDKSLVRGQTATRTATPEMARLLPTNEKHSPKLLLVDDNKINLRLLQTFMEKRKYTDVDSAENGQLAVEAAEMRIDGYDVIFMDISMPILNGFEATRAIRKIERDRVQASPQTDGTADVEPAKRHPSALIIALTGLASGRDQSEAFISGVDLFMTKPVSFKEVGKLLDNWEINSDAGTEWDTGDGASGVIQSAK